ncbi:hypothetical protein ACSTGZ_23435, partial [Vibrio parahaemolyticus]
TELVPQDKDVLESASILGGKIIATYLSDVKSDVRRFALDGKSEGHVTLPG